MEFGDAVGVVAALLSLVALYFAAKSANASVKAAGAADRSAEASEQSTARWFRCQRWRLRQLPHRRQCR